MSNHGTLTLDGKHIYQWVDKLAPFLTGEHTLDEITASLSEDRKRMVTGLITGLVRQGFVKDVGDDRPHGLDAAELAAYESEIAFIDYYRDSAAHRFETFRAAKVLLAGSGRTVAALVQACLHTGSREIGLLLTGETATDRSRIDEYVAHARERDGRQTVTDVPVPEWSDGGLAAAIAGYDVVIHVSDKPMLDRARLFNRVCAGQGTLLVQAVVDGRNAWAGPLVTGGDGACWECAWLRVLGRDGAAAELADRPEVTPSEFLAGPTAAIVASQLMFEVFKHRTEAGPVETAGALVRFDLETLQSANHPVTRHPLCTAHETPAPRTEREFLDAVTALAGGPELTSDEFSTAAAACFDEETGLLASLDEGDFGQLPLKVSRAEYGNVALLPGFDREQAAAVEVATDFTEARERATRRACELYAASAADRRRLADGRVWGLDLTTGEAREIDAAEVFPVLRDVAPSAANAPGLSSGATWAEALGRALLAHTERVTLAELATATGPRPRVDSGAVRHTELATRYLTMLDALGVEVTVHDVTGTLGVPTFVSCVDGRPAGAATGFDPAVVFETVLERALRHHQARQQNWPAYAVGPAVPEFPERLRGDDTAAPGEAGPGDWDEAKTELVRRLGEAGHRPVAVPLDHDPVLTGVLPYVVNVVLVEEN
ncbi:TOMM precursor leader peptide-binding protein [Amycolatopsis suaedae]|uniref:YcaO domain-containing protein n=1 Tax=Amycolatopsis suaedae TaxID=2510978 RepID=A0A4Q7JA88_9PSEU|nr:TOMM precursor leader peptide-binding protein [Amycolatopsis suaedae]RZQ63938.1 hypothetical protein EWH70_12395 [Amycolatopsis suaedae]